MLNTASEDADVELVANARDNNDEYECCNLPTQDVENILFVSDGDVHMHIIDNISKPDASEESMGSVSGFEILLSECQIEGASTSTPITNAYRRRYPITADTAEDLDISQSSSSSRKKLTHVSLDSEEDEEFDFSCDTVDGYRLVSMTSLAAVLSTLLSPCHKEEVLLKKSCSTWGLGTLLVLECSLCGKLIYFPNSQIESGRFSEIMTTGNTRPQDFFDINRRIVIAGLETGIGQTGMQTISDILLLHFHGQNQMWADHTKKILPAAKEFANIVMKEAREKLRKQILEENDQPYDCTTLVEVGVTYDGTWSSRGFTANYGIGFVISADTGQVLDYEFCSKFCQLCEKNPDADDEWKLCHKSVCTKNHFGSSKSMETKAAERLWGRSIAYNMRYKWMVCDGDSTSFNAVWDTYGSCDLCHKYLKQDKSTEGGLNNTDEFKEWQETHDNETANCNRVCKLDCIGHVQKRMGKHLLSWKKMHGVSPWKKLSNSKKVGRSACACCNKSHLLTMSVIKKFQIYYGRAIRQNVIPYGSSKKDIDVALNRMEKAVMAILWHSLLLEDESERHKYCPEKTEKYNWCEVKNGKNLKHREYHLVPEYLPFLSPIFKKLSQKSLMKRCLFGFSQNPNESLNARVWARAPKEKNKSPRVAEFATISALVQFNNGCVGINKLYSFLEIHNDKSQGTAMKHDKKRVKRAEYKKQKTTKERRQKMQQTKAKKNSILDAEELASYESGAFND